MSLLLSLLLAGAASSGAAGTPYRTGGALNLYVGTTGDDNNPCTSPSSPCLTIQAAVNKVPPVSAHTATVTVGLGNFAGYRVLNKAVETLDNSTVAGVLVTGTLTTATLASGLTSGTLTSATGGSVLISGWATATKTAAGWTASDLRHRYLRITGGTGSGQVKVIYDNTATVITVTGFWETTPDNTSTFDIVQPGTVITTPVDMPPNFLASGVNSTASTSHAGILIGGGSHSGTRDTGQYNARVAVRWFKCSLSGSFPTCVKADEGGRVAAFGIWDDNTQAGSGGFMAIGHNSELTVGECTGTRGHQIGQVNFGNLFIVNSVFSSATTGFFLAGSSRFSVQYSAILGVTARTFDLSNPPQDFNVLFSIFTGNGTSAALDRNAADTTVSGVYRVGFSSFTSFGNVVRIPGPALFILSSVSGGTNTNGFTLSLGANVRLDSSSTISATNEIILEGAAAVTIASLRAATPKVLPAATNAYGTRIFE